MRLVRLWWSGVSKRIIFKMLLKFHKLEKIVTLLKEIQIIYKSEDGFMYVNRGGMFFMVNKSDHDKLEYYLYNNKLIHTLPFAYPTQQLTIKGNFILHLAKHGKIDLIKMIKGLK